jgi:hypothetical protein
LAKTIGLQLIGLNLSNKELKDKDMEANEVPEKLYLDTTDNPDNVWLRAFRLPFNTCGIEYTRTDAFIEKATDWLEDHIYEYLKTNKTWNEADYDPQLIGDLRNYLKESKV